jgi:hypothetical protein
MSELFQIILTSSLTIIGGVIVYLFSQIISKFFVEPIHEQKKTIGEIADSLIYYANVRPSGTEDVPLELLIEAKKRYRQLATLLKSKSQLIPLYSFFSSINIVSPIENINEASKELIRLSNRIMYKELAFLHLGLAPSDIKDRIADMLNIQVD